MDHDPSGHVLTLAAGGNHFSCSMSAVLLAEVAEPPRQRRRTSRRADASMFAAKRAALRAR